MGVCRIPGVLEGLGSSRKLVGIISTYPGTSLTPWCPELATQTSGNMCVLSTASKILKKLIRTHMMCCQSVNKLLLLLDFPLWVTELTLAGLKDGFYIEFQP